MLFQTASGTGVIERVKINNYVWIQLIWIKTWTATGKFIFDYLLRNIHYIIINFDPKWPFIVRSSSPWNHFTQIFSIHISTYSIKSNFLRSTTSFSFPFYGSTYFYVIFLIPVCVLSANHNFILLSISFGNVTKIWNQDLCRWKWTFFGDRPDVHEDKKQK